MTDTAHIRLAHSPDSDDAFMFCGLATGAVETPGITWEHILSDIETLNQRAREGTYEVTALSVHAYAHLADRYRLMSTGASMGEGYGPIVVCREGEASASLEGLRVAVPGEWTSAYLALRLYAPKVQTSVVPFDRIGDVVLQGEMDAGVIIHEGQLTWKEEGLESLVDLGVWWREGTNLPLPLGANAVRRDLPEDLQNRLTDAVRRSVQWALDHREEALEHSLRYARGMAKDKADRFVGMYVNERTVDLGPDGREAFRLFLERGAQAGIVPAVDTLDFLGQRGADS
jgi:1,4-dihydroxy-6-naphthoate synthase